MQFVRRIAPNSTSIQEDNIDLVIPVHGTGKIDRHGPLEPLPHALERSSPNTLNQTPMPPTGDFEPEIVGLEIPVTVIRHLDFNEVVA